MESEKIVENPKMRIVPLKRFDNSFQANIVKGRLETEGIECFLTNDNLTTLFPQFTNLMGMGIDLMVSEENYEKAIEILNEKKEQSSAMTMCPNCNSENIKKKYSKYNFPKWIVFVFSILVYLPFVHSKYTYVCMDCKTEFSENNQT